MWNKEDMLFVGEDQIRKYFSKLDFHRSIGPGVMQLLVMMKLADVTLNYL